MDEHKYLYMQQHAGPTYILRSCDVSVTTRKTDATPQHMKAAKLLIMLGGDGAGDEIRTHDPNLGKVVLYP